MNTQLHLSKTMDKKKENFPWFLINVVFFQTHNQKTKFAVKGSMFRDILVKIGDIIQYVWKLSHVEGDAA